MNEVECNTWRPILQDRMWQMFFSKHRLVISKISDSLLILILIIQSLYCTPRIYWQHCFIATYSKPNADISILAYFLENQYMGALLGKILNPVLEHRVIVPTAWSDSTKPLVVIPILISWGELDGGYYLNFPFAVADQFYQANFYRSMSGLIGLNNIRLLCFTLRKPNIWNTSFIWY